VDHDLSLIGNMGSDSGYELQIISIIFRSLHCFLFQFLCRGSNVNQRFLWNICDVGRGLF